MQKELPKLGYSVPEFAQMIGLCVDTVYKEINSGRLKSFKVGKRRIISPDACKEYVKQRETETA